MRPAARGALPVLVVLLVAACVRDVPLATPPSTRGPPVATSSPSASAAAPETVQPPATVARGPSLADLVDADAMRAHLEALQAIADESGGSRATGTRGFDASVRFVAAGLTAAGYRVTRDAFEVGGTLSSNLIVEREGSTEDVIVLGAHLDSVAVGPGINDNASGVAALLVIAERLADLPPPHVSVRFAFWGAEEGGPFGSTAHLADLSSQERERIRAYLNFDMLASPNAVRFVYDEAAAAPGSEALTEAFASAFDTARLPWAPIDLEGDSDHGPFVAAGIPTGGLFSGGIEPVTDAHAATFDAVAGQPADPCSHAACDTIDNVDLATLEEMADAIARVLEALVRTP